MDVDVVGVVVVVVAWLVLLACACVWHLCTSVGAIAMVSVALMVSWRVVFWGCI